MSVQWDTAGTFLITTSADALLSTTAPFSASFWVNPTTDNIAATGGSPRVLVRAGAVNGSINIEIDTPRVLAVYVEGATTDLNKATVDNNIVNNTFQFYAITWDGSNDQSKIKIYRNGIEVSYQATSGNADIILTNSSGFTYIGNRSGGDRPCGANLTEVAIWNTVIGVAAITTLANGGQLRGVAGLPLTLTASKLQAYWPLNDYADGSNANSLTYKDLSANVFNATGSAGTGANPVSFVEQGYLSPSGDVWGY